mmetsp:Transcript_88966/g.155559  ORF Transcript_88966/g.155559 Transcript_88966/m.155559 type:complete len:322 (+) Transcript_88966:94-1059(+)
MASTPGPVAVTVALVTSLLSGFYLAGPERCREAIAEHLEVGGSHNETDAIGVKEAADSVKEAADEGVHGSLQLSLAESMEQGSWWLRALALAQIGDWIFYAWLYRRCKHSAFCKRWLTCCRRQKSCTIPVRHDGKEMKLSVVHEKGSSSLSAVHCANNLLQTTELSPAEFNSDALKLSPYSAWAWAKYLIGWGDYSAAVLLSVIKHHDKTLQVEEYVLPEPEPEDVACENSQRRLVGYICCVRHQGRCSMWTSSHWYAVVAVPLCEDDMGKPTDEITWCNCDPTLPAPDSFGNGDEGRRAVKDHLAKFQAEDGKVLIVWRK